VLKYDGKDLRTVTTFISDDLVTGCYYRFRVSAYNFNGEGPMSNELATYACVAPTNMLPPQKVASSDSSFTLSWKEPSDNGGCPILGYAVFRNEGANGPVTIEVNSVMDSNIRNKPYILSTTVTNYPAGSIGKVFTYQVEVFNIVRSSLSQTASFVFATVPKAPLLSPENESSFTSSEAI